MSTIEFLAILKLILSDEGMKVIMIGFASFVALKSNKISKNFGEMKESASLMRNDFLAMKISIDNLATSLAGLALQMNKVESSHGERITVIEKEIKEIKKPKEG